MNRAASPASRPSESFPETVVLPNGERYVLNAVMVDTSLRNGTDVNTEGQFKGDGIDGKDLTEMGMGAGGGMLIGGLAGGGKGLLIGGAVGATLTVSHWLGKKRSAVLPSGTELMMELSRPLAMTAENWRAVSKSGVGRQTFWRPTSFLYQKCVVRSSCAVVAVPSIPRAEARPRAIRFATG